MKPSLLAQRPLAPLAPLVAQTALVLADPSGYKQDAYKKIPKKRGIVRAFPVRSAPKLLADRRHVEPVTPLDERHELLSSIGTAPSGVHVSFRDGVHIYKAATLAMKVAQEVFQTEAIVYKRRLVINLQDWESHLLVTDVVLDFLQGLAEDYQTTICLKLANPEIAAYEIEPDVEADRQVRGGNLAAIGFKPKYPADERATMNHKTGTIKTGNGKYVRLDEMAKALDKLVDLYLARIINRSGASTYLPDPYEYSRKIVIDEIIALLKVQPKFCKPMIRHGMEIDYAADDFKKLFRDQQFGARTTTHQRDQDNLAGGDFVDTRLVSDFFLSADARRFLRTATKGEYAFFIRGDRMCVKLKAGQSFSDDVRKRTCFQVYMMFDGRFFIGWPKDYLAQPAYYFDQDGTAHQFFPDDVGDHMTEVYPGYTYELFGVRFTLPDVGHDYSRYFYEEQAEDDAYGPGEDHDSGTRTGSTYDPSHYDPSQDEDFRRSLLSVLGVTPEDITTRKLLDKRYRTLAKKLHPDRNRTQPEHIQNEREQEFKEVASAYDILKEHFYK